MPTFPTTSAMATCLAHEADRGITLSRRHVLGAGVMLPFAGMPPAFAQANDPIKIRATVALTGNFAELGQSLVNGTKAGFTAINAAGGINGRPVDYVAVDDAYDAKKAVANVEGFIAEKDVLSLLGCFGTPINDAVMPKILGAPIQHVAPFTGALSARPQNQRAVVNLRASYPDEVVKLVRQLATVGIKRIAVVHANSAFGKEVNAAAQAAMTEQKLAAAVTVSVENNGSDAPAAVDKVIASSPDAVLVGLAGKAALDFIKGLRPKARGVPLYGLSVMGGAGTLKALGADGVGLALSQVVPLPSSTATPLVRNFRKDWKDAGNATEPSHIALEGYINAKVFAEIAKRAGKTVTRASLIEAAWSLGRIDLGGFDLSFANPNANASSFIELTMVSKDGRFIR